MIIENIAYSVLVLIGIGLIYLIYDLFRLKRKILMSEIEIKMSDMKLIFLEDLSNVYKILDQIMITIENIDKEESERIIKCLEDKKNDL